MFDPTVFENLKVAFENRLYDLDNLEKAVAVTGRRDLLDLAAMAREFRLRFMLAEGEPGHAPEAEVVLQAGVDDLAAEILETPGGAPACTLLVRFYTRVADPDTDCPELERLVRTIWQPELAPVQTLSFVFGNGSAGGWLNTLEVRFNRRINEDQIPDIPELLAHAVETLDRLALVSE